MKVLNCSHIADTGGNGWRTKLAFQKLTDWDYRTTCRTTNYIDYPQDLPWSDAYAHWVASDVVHVRDGFQAQARLDAPDRPTVIHHHGTVWRKNKDELLRIQRKSKAIGLAATLDIYLDAPDDLEWMPALYDINWLHRMRELAHQPDDGVFRVGHNPTNRAVKSTDLLIQAVDRLKRKIKVELVLTEKVPWDQSLRAKAGVDVYFDQALLGYGNNAIEAWGMQIPVIAGGEDRTLDEMKRRFGDLPFLQVTPSVRSIEQAILLLIDPDTWLKWSVRGHQHAQTWHSDRVVVPMLQKVYERVAR